MEKTVTVLFCDEVYDMKTMRCVEIGVIAIQVPAYKTFLFLNLYVIRVLMF